MSQYREPEKTPLKEKLESITGKLSEGVRNLFDSEAFKAYLKTNASFYQYSTNNLILIYSQRPDATLVASYTRWRSLGRNVKKGEQGIQILCPSPYKKQMEVMKRDSYGQPVLGRNGKPETELVEKQVQGYKIGYIFDISQTEGKPLAELPIRDLTGNVEQYERFRDALIQIAPVPVSFEPIDNDARGYFSIAEQKIVVAEGMSQEQTLKTLVHELAHSIIDNQSGQVPFSGNLNTREVRAESIAYCVLYYYGIDSSDYSFSYIGSWSRDKSLEELKTSLDIIHKTAGEMIGQLEQHLTRSETDLPERTEGTDPGPDQKEKLPIYNRADPDTRKLYGRGR